MSSFRRRLKGYKHTSDVVSFVRQAQQRSDVVALILFGSLAKEDFYEHSDADVCVVLQQPAVHPLLRDVDAFWQDAPPGIIELHIYGSQQFKQMIRQANGLALEVMHYGVALSGDRFYLTEIERLFRETRRDLSLVRVGNGWVVGQR